MAATQSPAFASSTSSHFQPTRTQRAPLDLGTYSRALLSYTQRQMEGLRIGYSRSETASGDKSASPPVSAPTNGNPSSASTTTTRTARRRSPSTVTSASSVAVNPPSSPVSSEFGYRE